MNRRVELTLAMMVCACASRGVIAERPCATGLAPVGQSRGAANDADVATTAADAAADAAVGAAMAAAEGDDGVGATVVVATTDGDLDGDGRVETVRLYGDGVMRVFHGDDEVRDAYGQRAGRVVPFEATSSREGGGAFVLRAVDIDRRDRRRELMLRETRGDEDPPGDHSFWVYRERRLRPMLRRATSEERWVWAPHGDEPMIAGDGAVRFEYDRCVRDEDEHTHTRGITEHVSLRYTLTDGVMPHGELMESIRTTRRASRCVQAACPVVRVGASQWRVGEILRELRGEGSARWQSLALPTTAVDGDGVLRVTPGEEKHEVTRLDGVYVDADGRRVAPDGCAGAAGGVDGVGGVGGVSGAGEEKRVSGVDAWCVADAESATLTPGQSLTLRFRVGAARSVTLWARGYYTTLPATHGGDDPLDL